MLWLLLALQEPTVARPDTEPFVRDLEQRYARIQAVAAKSVVAIHTKRGAETKKRTPRIMSGFMGSDVFGKRPSGPVTGVVVDADGWVLTTYFNISGKVEELWVVLPDGQKRTAELKGYDAITDLAMLKIEGGGLTALSTARPEKATLGAGVVAVGVGPSGEGLTLNPGIVSALDRVLGWAIQHDARLNYGNVGGPLFDLDGRLLGLTTGVSVEKADTTGQNSGVGEAIVWEKVAESLAYLKGGGRNKGAFLGIQGGDRDEGGINVQSVQEGTAAEKCGLKDKDVILEFDGKKVNTMEELRSLITRRRIGDKLKVLIERAGEQQELDVELGERPEN
jgi:S1-C subfamily serine protease